MLGKLIFEVRGKPTAMRVLKNGNLELSVAMRGTFLGEDFQTTWTGEIESRPDGARHSEAWGIFTIGGEIAGSYKVIGNGIIRPDGSGNSRGAICNQFPPGKFAYLNKIAVVYEMEFDKEYNITNKGWGWQ